MPAKKKKSRDRVTDPKVGSTASDSSLDLGKEVKPKKQKPLTKKEKERLKRMEKEMKEALIQLRKNADMALAEFKAMEEASEKKAKAELFEHNKRVELVAGTCETFKMAKARLLHENNKLRDAEIWERYLANDRKPYPENVPNMHDHLYLWRQAKETEYMEFALSKCDSYIDTLRALDELIEHPLYSLNATVNNWKEVRREWRDEFLRKIDKACFNMIKNLSKNFEQEATQSHIFSFDDGEEHVKIGMCAYVEYKTLGIRVSPKIRFPTVNAEIVMPAAYRTNPFILRIVHLDQDFLSESSLTYYCPESLHMESDLLKEIHRCFEAKKDAKSLVADREREKVRQAKQKVLEAQAAAHMAEKSFNTFQQQNIDPIKRRESKSSLSEKAAEGVKEPKKKKTRPDIIVVTGSESSIGPGGLKRPRGVMDDRDGESMAKSLMQSTGTKRTLDAISMKSGMRRKHDRLRKTITSTGVAEPEPCSIFWTHSMLSLTNHHAPKVECRRASELCFEDSDEEVSRLDISDPGDDDSYDSLDLMFGRDDEENPKVKPLRDLVKDTVIVDREANKQPRAKSTASISYDGKKGRRRGKSNANPLKGRGQTEESDETMQTASEIFDTAEEIRQEHYMSSLLYSSIPQKNFHINLREYCTVGGMYLLDIIFHELQPHTLRNGNTVQIFYGEMNIKRDDYQYDYTPPPPPGPDDDPDEPVLDAGLQHLLHVKLSLPRDIVIFDPPIVALWDRQLKFWSKEHVHKVEIDLASGSASFSISRVQPFAFFSKKYCLLPFDSWNMKPKLDTGGVTLSLQSLRATLEFQIEGFKVCLSRAETSDGGVIFQLTDIMGEFMHLHKLIGMMEAKGLNIFPDEDGFLYTENSCKDVVLEDHTCMSMAMFADTLEFLSCELNTDFKRRKLAFRVRECLAYNLELRYRTVVATCLSAQIYRMGLDDASFDETKNETAYGFCPDAYSILEKAFAHVSSPSPPNPLQIVAVYSLLSRIKVFSYCGIIHQDKSVSSSDGSKKSIRKKGKKGTKQKQAKSIKSRSSNQSLSLVPSTASDIIY